MAAEGMESYTFDVEADRKLDRQLQGSRFPIVEDDPNNPQSLDTDVRDGDPEAGANAARELAEEDAKAAQKPSDEIAFLKKVTGDQGNELGELRRELAARKDSDGRIAQLEAEVRRAQAPVQGEFDMFDGIPDDQKFMSPLERRQVSMKFQELAQAAATEIQKARDEAQYFAAKTASGVDANLERELVQEHPFLNSLAGVQKAEAITQMARYRKSAEGAPNRSADEVARSAARAASHTESSNGAGTGAEDSLEPAAERLLREARAGRHNAEVLGEKMRKIGIPRYDSNGIRY